MESRYINPGIKSFVIKVKKLKSLSLPYNLLQVKVKTNILKIGIYNVTKQKEKTRKKIHK